MKGHSEEQVAEYKEVFNLFDKNGDGAISVEELGRIINALGMKLTDMELQDMINEIGTDGGEVIDFQQFVSLMGRQSGDKETEIREAFKIFDRDGDGRISANELKEVMLNMGEKIGDKEIADIIKEADLDGDGEISYAEFVRMMK